jgi:hypothetical protein
MTVKSVFGIETPDVFIQLKQIIQGVPVSSAIFVGFIRQTQIIPMRQL